jgi:hypothetical protein
MDNAQDVIQFSLDNMGREVNLVLRSATGRLIERRGTVTGLATGPVDTITVDNYRYPDGYPITERTLVELAEIIDISLAGEGA